MAESPRGTVVLVAQDSTENIGVRILLALLRREGHQAVLVPFCGDSERLLRTVADLKPQLVGFSIIFQNLTDRFQEQMRDLRAAGVRAHLTAGGHFPSFAFESLLRETPALDSVVRFEGEDTLLELTAALSSGDDWRGIEGLAWRDGDSIVANPQRQGRRNLDTLPWPDRDDLEYSSGPLPTASLLGSRGCPHGCTFCSIAPFYRSNGTPGRRFRRPVAVVDEMEWLHRKGARVLLFQDDDFLGGGRRGVAWAHELAAEVIARNLNQNIRWRIACRSDEVTEDALRPLVEAGLVHVYLGVESGDSQHLEDLGKNTTAERHLEAARTLTELGVGFDFGYMLLTPWSTIGTLRSNLAFLEEISSGGLAAAGFCRTLPYAGTSIADRLQTEGRLLPGCHADYPFNDPRLDSLWEWMYRTLNHRNQDPEGTRNLLSILLFESIVDLPGHPRNDGHLARLRSLARCSNELMFDVVGSAVDHVAYHDKQLPQDDEYLVWLTGFHRAHDARIRTELEWICRMRAHDNAGDLSGVCHDTQAPGPTALGA